MNKSHSPHKKQKPKQSKERQNSKPVYPWDELKVGFFKSGHVLVRDYFREALGPEVATEEFFCSLNFKNKTKFWADEKRHMKKEATARAIKEFEDEYATILKDSYRFAVKQINEDLRKGIVPAKHLKAYWEMIRTEMGLVTRIVKQENSPAELDDLDMERLLDTIRENAKPIPESSRKSSGTVEAAPEEGIAGSVSEHEALGEATTSGEA